MASTIYRLVGLVVNSSGHRFSPNFFRNTHNESDNDRSRVVRIGKWTIIPDYYNNTKSYRKKKGMYRRLIPQNQKNQRSIRCLDLHPLQGHMVEWSCHPDRRVFSWIIPSNNPFKNWSFILTLERHDLSYIGHGHRTSDLYQHPIAHTTYTSVYHVKSSPLIDLIDLHRCHTAGTILLKND